jgi:dTDP-glucose pyrophosphorylase
MTLVILAAGMGSRFGGLKQIEPVGPNKEFIIDYSIYDAIRSGFKKVIFIIKEENLEIFKETVGQRVSNFIKTEYVFQKNDNVDDKYKVMKERVKPLGTAHAIICCKEKINGPFLIINSDDFYGLDAFKKAAEYLAHKGTNNGVVAYKLKNTLSKTGTVKRGIIKEENKKLKEIIESNAYEENGVIYSKPLEEENYHVEKHEALVNMNMLALDEDIFPFLEKEWIKFQEDNIDNQEKCEFLIPTELSIGKNMGLFDLDVIETDAKWYGVTYKEDTEYVKEQIKKMCDEKIYPHNLWER